MNKKVINLLSLIIFIILSQNVSADDHMNCDNPKSYKEKISCKILEIKKSQSLKKYNEIREKKTLTDLFTKKD